MSNKIRYIIPAWISLLSVIIVFFVFTPIYQKAIQIIIKIFLGYVVVDNGLWECIISEMSLLLAALTSVSILLKLEKMPLSILGWSFSGHLLDLWYGGLFALAIYVIEFAVSIFEGWVIVTGYYVDFKSLSFSLLFFILVSFTEEILFRGYILRRLLDTHLNKFLSLLVSSVLFALLHIFNPNVTFLSMLNLILAGLLLGASYIYTRNLWFPIGLHLFWNWIQGPILGYKVSGSNYFSSLLQLQLSEDVIWNGGPFGFEGSLVCSILMIICIILIVCWGEKKARYLEEYQSC